MKGFRVELDTVIATHVLPRDELIVLSNINHYEKYLESISFKSKHGKTIIFTNANGWYIETLVKNLIKSVKSVDAGYKIGVICSDLSGFETASKIFDHTFLAHIPLLKVNNLTKVNKWEDYTRLVFVKTVLIYHALILGYTVIYLDPDMAFLKPSIDYIINAIDDHGLVLAGIKGGNMNTNIIGAVPSSNNIKIFEVDVATVEANILNKKIHNRYAGSDEEFIAMKKEYDMDKIHFLDFHMFPPGNHVKKEMIKNVMILHANGVSGLDNKIKFMQSFDAWKL